MNCRITLTANAGMILDFGQRYLIDALHSVHVPGFSTLDDEKAERVLLQADETPPAAILFSHGHPDHYSEEYAKLALGRYPDSAYIFPEKEHRAGSTIRIRRCGTAAITSLPLVHRTAKDFPETDNFGFIIEDGGSTFFFPGDAEPASEEMTALAGRFHPDVAALPFMWITLPSCRKILTLLSPRHVVLLHLPFPEEDIFGYIAATEASADRYRPDSAVMTGFLQSAEFTL